MNTWDKRSLTRLLWPLVVEQVLAVTMGAADTIMVSSVGEAAVSGVNIIDNINNLFIIAFTALCTGGTVVVSQYLGRGDGDNSRSAARQLYYVVVLAALAVMIPAMLWRRGIIRFLYGSVPEEVMSAASIYFLITAASYPFLGIYNACAALFRSEGNSKVPMRIALMVNITNIAGNSLFIFGLGLGAEGAALATLSSRIIAAGVLTAMLVRGASPASLRGLRRVALNRDMIRRILSVGIPSGLEGSMFQTGRLLTQRIFTSFGTAAIAGNAIASVINSFSFMPGSAYGMALLTVVGQCMGAGNIEEARRNTARIMKMSWLTLFALSGGIFLFMEPLVSLFRLSAEAHRMAVDFLRVHCVSMSLSWSFSFALPNALRAAGDARYVMISAAASMFAVRVSCAYLITFVLGAGPLGVWIAMGLDFAVRGSCYALRWRSGKWRDKRVI
ncbi:MAG: MATE family efflux transporter [Treponema sp.]|jgi:putative MATE family efflux protein|nr:MATE family efflux transporter [Treponema sp.]